MTTQHEVLLLCDRDFGDHWHLHPEIRECLGWWPDGSPAWVDEPDGAACHRFVIDVIPKRRPIGDCDLEDHPSVETLIDTAITLNDVFRPRPGSSLADAYAMGDRDAQSQAMLARIRHTFGPTDAADVLALAREVARLRVSSDGPP